MPFTR